MQWADPSVQFRASTEPGTGHVSPWERDGVPWKPNTAFAAVDAGPTAGVDVNLKTRPQRPW